MHIFQSCSTLLIFLQTFPFFLPQFAKSFHRSARFTSDKYGGGPCGWGLLDLFIHVKQLFILRCYIDWNKHLLLQGLALTLHKGLKEILKNLLKCATDCLKSSFPCQLFKCYLTCCTITWGNCMTWCWILNRVWCRVPACLWLPEQCREGCWRYFWAAGSIQQQHFVSGPRGTSQRWSPPPSWWHSGGSASARLLSAPLRQQ